ncbi:MAG: hypothetical protein IPL61_30885 [Myxococcales bacterium]|nr:hypothetical protein [Myxococcales bacterium]
MLPQLVGRTLAENTGLNAHARAAGERAGMVNRLRAWGAHVDYHLAMAPDAATARRILAGEWSRIATDWAEAIAPGLSPITARIKSRWALLRFATLADTRFDELPLIATGLVASGTTWRGTAAQVAAAATSAHERGLKLDEADGTIRLVRRGAVVATLVADPAAAPAAGAIMLAAARGPIGWGLTAAAGFLGVLGGIMALAQGLILLAVALMTVPVSTVLALRWAVARARRHPWRPAAITLAPRPAGAPYRDRSAAADAVPVAKVVALAQAAGLTARVAGRRLSISVDDRVEVTVAIAPAHPLALTRLAVRHRHYPTLMRLAHALGAEVGPLRLELEHGALEVPGPDGWASWRAAHDAEERALAGLIQRFQLARARAIATLR